MPAASRQGKAARLSAAAHLSAIVQVAQEAGGVGEHGIGGGGEAAMRRRRRQRLWRSHCVVGPCRDVLTLRGAK